MRGSQGFFGCQVACYCRVSCLVRTGEDIYHVLHMAGIFATAPSLSISIACRAATPAGPACPWRWHVWTAATPNKMLLCAAECGNSASLFWSWMLTHRLGPGSIWAQAGRGAAALCETTVLPLTSCLKTLPFIPACNWEWGKESFAEGHNVFTASKKKKKKKKHPESPQLWKPSSMSRSPS